jgi:hypothetical protein
MILGVNWYREFPKGLYKYKFFDFKNSPGGFADWPAELYTSVKIPKPEEFIHILTSTVNTYKQARLFFKQSDNHIFVKIGWYHLFDFDFEITKKIDGELNRLGARRSVTNYSEVELQKLGDHNFHINHYHPKNKGLSLVHSAPGKKNSCIVSLRLDCHLDTDKISGFISDLKNVANKAGIYSIYYMEKQKGKTTYLYVFLTNGRQGLNLSDMVVSDGKLLENELTHLYTKYEVQSGIGGDYRNGPSGDKKIVEIQDIEFHQIKKSM